MSVDYLLNQTQNAKLKLSCQSCSGKTNHVALVTVDIAGREGDENFSIDWYANHQIVQCLGCNSVSFRTERGNSEDYIHSDETGIEYISHEEIYPPRIEGYRGLGERSFHLPQTIKEIYDETLTALSVQSPILAGIGLRALVEAVCREKEAKGRNLNEQINHLVELGVINKLGADILHNIRTLGNAAAHEAKPHTESQLAVAMDIVETMLKNVYILPGMAAIEFKPGQ